MCWFGGYEGNWRVCQAENKYGFCWGLGYARCVNDPPTFSSIMSSSCKPFLYLPVFSFFIEQWEQKHLSENTHFGKVYRRQIHQSILCYLLLRHFFFSILFWLSCLSLPSVSVIDFWLPCANLSVCSSMCVCVCMWWGMGKCKVEEWLQNAKLLFIEEVQDVKS